MRLYFTSTFHLKEKVMPSNQNSNRGSSSQRSGSQSQSDMDVSEAASIMGRKGGQRSHGGHGSSQDRDSSSEEDR
jgi:hypothetical protein